jgi:hypothetical protein
VVGLGLHHSCGVRLLRAAVVSGLVPNLGAASSEIGIGVNFGGNQMPTMADLGAHRGAMNQPLAAKQKGGKKGGPESVRRQGGRIGGMTGGGARLGSHTAERAGESKQLARKQLTAARHKSHEMSVADLLAQLKQVTEDKEKENDGVTGALPKFFLTFRLLLSLC